MPEPDDFTYMPMQDGPGVYVPAGAEDAFHEICANNGRLARERAARAADDRLTDITNRVDHWASNQAEAEYHGQSAGPIPVDESDIRYLLGLARSAERTVRDFHEAFGFHVADQPDVPPEHIRVERARLIAEEAGEAVSEIMAGHPDRAATYHQLCDIFADRSNPADHAPDPTKVARELADVQYVTAGAAVNWGLPLRAVFAEIHAANMRKLGPDGQPIHDEHGKAVKPAGWYPADIHGLIRDYRVRSWSA